MEPKDLLEHMPALMRVWLHAIGVPDGAAEVRIVLDGRDAHVTYHMHGLKTRHVLPMPLYSRSNHPVEE